MPRALRNVSRSNPSSQQIPATAPKAPAVAGRKNRMRFFRPATAGAFGAVAGICWLLGFDRETLRNALGIVYGQLSGNMQAHKEGSVLLALQIGFNARNAVIAGYDRIAGVKTDLQR